MLHGLETELGECHSLSLGEQFQWNVLLCMLTASDYEVGLPRCALQLSTDNPFKGFRDLVEIGNRTIIFEFVLGKFRFFQERGDDSISEFWWHRSLKKTKIYKCCDRLDKDINKIHE